MSKPVDVIFNNYKENEETTFLKQQQRGKKHFEGKKIIFPKEGKKKLKEKNCLSHTGNRTRATAVRAPDPNHYSPVDLRFDLEQIATETNSSKIVSIGLQKQHIKNHMKSIWCNTLKI